MSAAHTRVDGVARRTLRSGWAIRSAVPGSAQATDEASPPADDAPWTAAESLGPVAAVLRDAGLWSLDGVPLRFDGSDWWYRLRFDAPELAGSSDLVLGFDGLATLARVWLNGRLILHSDNMFLAQECSVGPLLREQGNELLICFGSLDAALAARRPRPRWRVPMAEHQQLRWFRTTLLGRTPGWSPPCAAVGPWRDVWLEQRDGVALHDLRLQAALAGDDGVVEIDTGVHNDGGIDQIRLELERAGHSQACLLRREADGRWRAQLRWPKVERWWPHTHGEPALYEATLHVTRQDAGDARLSLGRVGFRRVELDHDGDGFVLRINGEAIFCRGACWTPVDVVTLRSDEARCRDTITRARSAGMNMLRVTGTNVYEDATFFDLCDELGMLVWQDFMFANMDFPDSGPAFMDNLRREATQHLARWQRHASIVLLCGNSEVAQQAAMWGAPRESWSPAWFHEELPALCRQFLPHTPYWPSSAWGGALPQQVDAGTTSYYGVGAYLRPLEDARRSGLRFATECLAFANVPSDATLARIGGQGSSLRVTHPGWKARSPRDLGAGWDFDDVRDHYLKLLFGIDPVQLRYSDHARYLLLSRLASGEAMAAAFSEWRRHGSACAGALVLFLRDLWAGAGWGLLDDEGEPKACWHAISRVLQPCAVLLTDEGNSGLAAHLVNERTDAVDARLSLSVWRGAQSLCSVERPVRLDARSCERVMLTSLPDHFMDLNHAYRFGPLNHDAVVVALHAADGSLLSQSFHFPRGLVLPADPNQGLAAVASHSPDGTVQVTLSTQGLAVAVHFDAPGHVADDEYFHLAPGQQRDVTLRRRAGHRAPWHGSVNALNAASPTTIRSV